MNMLSIIIPVYNEASSIQHFLRTLVRNKKTEVILVDGGSTDDTLRLATPLVDQALLSPCKGRAAQMNYGASKASGDVLLFLHADTELPENYFSLIDQVRQEGKHLWGRFDVCLSGKAFMFRVIAFMMNQRSRLTGIATGDQAIFVKHRTFTEVGGFENIPLMEDIAFSRTMKQLSRPACIRQKLQTSSRRWEKQGIWKTIFLMWRLRLTYFFNASPQELAKKYD